MGIGTLVFKDNKLIGKPSPRYKEDLTFEKKTEKHLSTIYNTAKETFAKYISIDFIFAFSAPQVFGNLCIRNAKFFLYVVLIWSRHLHHREES